MRILVGVLFDEIIDFTGEVSSYIYTYIYIYIFFLKTKTMQERGKSPSWNPKLARRKAKAAMTAVVVPMKRRTPAVWRTSGRSRWRWGDVLDALRVLHTLHRS